MNQEKDPAYGRHIFFCNLMLGITCEDVKNTSKIRSGQGLNPPPPQKKKIIILIIIKVTPPKKNNIISYSFLKKMYIFLLKKNSATSLKKRTQIFCLVF
jgi:hypothetical protein